MIKHENECVGCVDLGLPCMGAGCPNRDVMRFYCDRCGGEDTLYHYDGMQLCEGCIMELLDEVTADDE